MDDPKRFAGWRASHARQLRPIVGPIEDLRRSGPVDLYQQEKIIVRATTGRHQRGRLAAIVDTQGLWFTDKFLGVWVHDGDVPITALAAYFQTRFVELWLATNNPSRKLRVGALERMPIPKLSPEWWIRAGTLVKENEFTIAPRWRRQDQVTLFEKRSERDDDWEWFEGAVDTAFGISATQAPIIEEFLSSYLHSEGFAPS